MQTFTIYVTSADITTLNVIFNGVAMICKQNALIWGFAMLASVWILLASSTKTTLTSVTGGSTDIVLTSGVNAILPFILAILLTTGDLKGTVQIESDLTGQVTQIDNVPAIISAIPAVGSLLSREVSQNVQTAFQNANAEYPLISSSGNGFINPLKTMLAARSAINRLNGVSSELDDVVTSCLTSDTGSKANIINLVNNAGNSGATAATSIAIDGANPTPLGALLYQASLTDAYVNSLTNRSGEFLNCADAANQVADDIALALHSQEFSRVVQGAVNGMDQPSIAANTQIDQMYGQWKAIRDAKSIGAAVSIGSQQAQNEMITLLTAELTSNEIACIDTSGQSRVTCESSLVQANEIERNNIQLAAAEVPMLKYVGSFGNYLLALIIGLGPIIVMFMMFAGVNAGKCVKTVAHLIAWPLLVTNVGAEIINGMMYVSIANFVDSLASGGVLTQAQNVAVYKELSFQIGSASHMMASLPVLMGMIFALGESAALVSVATNIAPRNEGVRDNLAPKVAEQSPIISNSGFMHNTIGPDVGEQFMNGAMPQISSNLQLANAQSQSSNAIRSAEEKQRSIDQSASVAKDTSRALDDQNYKGWDISDSHKKELADYMSKSFNQRDGYDHNNATDKHSDISAANDKTMGVQGSVRAHAGVGGGDLSLGVSGDATALATKTGRTSAADTLSTDDRTTHNTDLQTAKDTGKRLQAMEEYARSHGFGEKEISSITSRKAANEQYIQHLSQNESSSNSKESALSQSEAVTGYASGISTLQYAAQYARNPEMAAYNIIEGHSLEKNPAFKDKLQKVQAASDNEGTSHIIGNQDAEHAANTFKAATLMAQDKSLSVDDRFEAQKFVTGAMSHLMGTSFETPRRLDAPKSIDASPTNVTGIEMPHSSPSQPQAIVPPKTQSSFHKHSQPHSSSHHGTNNAQHQSNIHIVPNDGKQLDGENEFREEYSHPLTKDDVFQTNRNSRNKAEEFGLDGKSSTDARTSNIVRIEAGQVLQSTGLDKIDNLLDKAKNLTK